jgi:hypothetical protein
MKKILTLIAVSLSLVSWGNDNAGAQASDSTYYKNDNTGKNVRDRDSNNLTPLDQSESESDRTITQEIRKAVMADDSLSTNAKNIKIITINGVVTLRGPVLNACRYPQVSTKCFKSLFAKPFPFHRACLAT